MPRYVVLLRGINVGGKNKLSMAALKEVLEDLGCENVATYINSGNVVLDSKKSASALGDEIERLLPRKFKLDSELIRRLMTTHEVVVTIEEASIGGLGAHVLTLASDEGLTDAGLKIRTMRLPDAFQDHDAPDKQYDEARLNAPHIVETVLAALRHNSAGVEEARA